uniref:Uncharacterized protein n=1 Tax=Anguilla anguilla TaxID=7936 RepID=A0A0E9XC85_ANGAN
MVQPMKRGHTARNIRSSAAHQSQCFHETDSGLLVPFSICPKRQKKKFKSHYQIFTVWIMKGEGLMNHIP